MQSRGGPVHAAFLVLAGLEVVRCLNDLGIQTRKPLEVAVWTNEEGARFTPAMFGSAVFTGIMPLDAALAVTREGYARLGERIRSLGVPCLIVQEGGYHLESLEDNARAFFVNAEVWQL